MTNIKEKVCVVVQSFGLVSIGLISIGYMCFSSTFAEFHVFPRSLGFPIFIGELLFFLCAILATIRCLLSPLQKEKRWLLFLVPYALFISVKAAMGYVEWGPFALRNAALFYYPMFICFGYLFFTPRFFSNAVRLSLFCLIMLLFVTNLFSVNWAATCWIGAFILAWTQGSKGVRYGLIVLFMLCTPYRYFFLTPRMMIVANISALAYGAYVFFSLSTMRNATKAVIVGGAFFLFMFGLMSLGDRDRISSILNFNALGKIYTTFDAQVDERIDAYEPVNIASLHVYNPDEQPVKWPRGFWNIQKTALPARGNGSVLGEMTHVISQVLLEEKGVAPSLKPAGTTDAGYYTAAFRLFIWRDMLREFFWERPVFGFSFGRPVRSPSLETLNWGTGDWSRDGWIAPHNSYLHLIYRGGIIGIIFVGVAFFILFRMIRFFLAMRSIVGLLLCGILVNWFVAANFLLIFELPYTAIPIWTIYGLTCAYYFQLRDGAVSGGSISLGSS